MRAEDAALVVVLPPQLYYSLRMDPKRSTRLQLRLTRVLALGVILGLAFSALLLSLPAALAFIGRQALVQMGCEDAAFKVHTLNWEALWLQELRGSCALGEWQASFKFDDVAALYQLRWPVLRLLSIRAGSLQLEQLPPKVEASTRVEQAAPGLLPAAIIPFEEARIGAVAVAVKTRAAAAPAFMAGGVVLRKGADLTARLELQSTPEKKAADSFAFPVTLSLGSEEFLLQIDQTPLPPLAAALLAIPAAESWPVVILGGVVSSRFTLRRFAKPGAAAQVLRAQQELALGFEGRDISGLISGAPFRGLKGAFLFDLSSGLCTQQPAVLQAEELNPGFPLRSLRGSLSLPCRSGPLRLEVRDLEAAFAGGILSSPGLIYQPGAAQHSFTVLLKGLELAALLALYPQEGLSGAGVLDGELPVEISAAGVRIIGGRVAARAPGGTIRYKSPATVKLSQDHSTMAFAWQALEHLQYDTLQAGVNYEPAGTLTLSLHLQGRNPDLNTSRPLDVSVSVEENVPALLKSLLIGKQIEGRLRSKASPTAGSP